MEDKEEDDEDGTKSKKDRRKKKEKEEKKKKPPSAHVCTMFFEELCDNFLLTVYVIYLKSPIRFR